MAIKDIFKKILPAKKAEEEGPVEVSEEGKPKQQVTVRIENLKDFVDIDRILRLLKDGNIVFLKTAELQRHDLGEFQNCILKLKRVCGQNGWDLVGTEEGYIVLTPGFARIER